MPGGITGYPVLGGNKYRNLTLQVEGVSKIEAINILVSPVGLRSEKVCASYAQQELKTTDPTSRQRGRPTSRNRSRIKIIRERRRKICGWSQISARHRDRLAD
jgi:hypothetical protein